MALSELDHIVLERLRRRVQLRFGSGVLLKFDQVRVLPEHQDTSVDDLVNIARQLAYAAELEEFSKISSVACDSSSILAGSDGDDDDIVVAPPWASGR